MGIHPTDGHREARAKLESAGWTWLARGDWAHVYASPDGRLAARVCAFDPAYSLHVRTCLAHPQEPHFPRIAWRSELAPAGEIVVMERHHPADADAAKRLCDRLRGQTPPELRPLRELLERTAAEGERTLGCFGGLDVRPGNVMQDASGRLELIDHYIVAGKRLIQAMLEDAPAVAKRYTREQLAAFLEIAVFEEEEHAPGPILVELRQRVARLGSAEKHS
jgi:hypothetical protein